MSKAHSMGHLRCERIYLRRDTVRSWVIAAMPVTSLCTEHLGRADATRNYRCRVAISRKKPVLLLKCSGASYLASLLSC